MPDMLTSLGSQSWMKNRVPFYCIFLSLGALLALCNFPSFNRPKGQQDQPCQSLHVQRRQDPAEEATLTMPEMLSSFGSEFWMKNQLFRVTFVGFASLHIFICNKYFKILYQLLHCKYLHLRKLTVTIRVFSVIVKVRYVSSHCNLNLQKSQV